MAEGFLFNMIEKLIVKLGDVVVEAWNVRDDVKKLVKNMREIYAVIYDAEEQQQVTNNHQVKLWLDDLKDTLYDVEDLLDDVSTEHLRRQVMTRDKKAKKVRIFFSSSNPLVSSFNMAPKIKELRKSIEELNINGKSFNFTNRRPAEPRVRQLRENTHSYVLEDQVIGRDEEKKKLIESLMLNTNINAKENVSVISIVGFGGLGKTALAQLVYNDKAIQQHFELKMWVCVADDSDVRGFDLKSVAEKILESKNNGEMDQVQRKLREKVNGKRYLLVLDDTWNEEHDDWVQLMTLLADGAKGSKIIVTTRSQRVPKIIGTSSSLSQKMLSSSLFLDGLDEKKSWRLFTQIAFKNGQEPESQRLVSIGKEIVKKCAGFPLAIRSIGYLMSSMESEEDWSNIKEKNLVKIDEANKVFHIIKLSYDHLPFHLKKCFAFCSLFPKDQIFIKIELIQLWIAEGFVHSSDENTSLEDTAEKYLMTLVHGSFFQDIKRDIYGDISKFKMHDIVHDLACFIAKNDYVMVNEKVKHIDKQTRHMYVDSLLDSSGQVPSFLLQANKLRTFLWNEEEEMKESDYNQMISNFKKVRVLKFCNKASTTIPSCIGMLKHLRYLDLSNNNQIEVLPSSITELINLETLLLNWCSKLRELPKDLWKLTSLRHLELEFCDSLTCMPCGIGRLAKLQTLTQFVLGPTSKHNASASELRELNNLRGKLEINGLEYLRLRPTEAKEMNLIGKSHLQSLELRWGNDVDGDANDMEKDDIILQHLLMQPNIKALQIDGFEGVGVAFSWSDKAFKNLKKFSLFSCKRLQYLPQLEVKSIFLDDLPCLEWIINDNSNGNSSALSPLSITLWNLHNLKGWCRCSEEEMQRGCCHHQFKSVDYMEITNCPNMISIPQCTGSIGWLELYNVREKIFRQAVIHSKVKSLCLIRIDDLKYLSGVLQHLTTLEHLEINDCKELDLCNDENGCYSMQWKELKNLKKLKFKAIPKVEYLPEGLQHVTALQALKICNCTNLTFLPGWVTSVSNLRIEDCPKLVSLPNGLEISKG